MILYLLFTLLYVVNGSSIALVASSQHMLKFPFESGQLQNILSAGDVEYGNNSVKLARPIPHSKGAIWFNNPNTFADWQATFSFTMKGPEQGSDGIGFWYARYPGKQGQVFGGPDKWHGLGVFVDGFDNDNRGNNPAIMGVLNQGDIQFRMDMDGEGQYFGGCVRNVRNTKTPVMIRVTFINKILKVEINDNIEKEEYINCMERANTDLPVGYYFGVSAGTGQIPDEFYIHSFNLYELKRKDSEISSKAEAAKNINSGNNANVVNNLKMDEQKESELEKGIKNMQSNINVMFGPFKPGDKNLFKRITDIE